MASLIMSNDTRQPNILFKIQSYHNVAKSCAIKIVYARSQRDDVVGRAELAYLGSLHGHRKRLWPWVLLLLL
jgi:hypothetical protein